MSTVARAKHGWLAAVAAAAIVLLAACDDTDPSKSSPDSATSVDPSSRPTPAASGPDQLRKARVAWSRRLPVLGQPVEAGSAVVVLARTPAGGVEVVSLDRRSGRENFRVPFHPGGLPSGVAMTPRTTRTDAGRHLVVVRQGEPGTAEGAIQALDARTGAVVATTPAAVDDYDACSDGHDVCWSGYAGGFDMFGPTGGAGPTRWDLETGALRENERQEAAMLVGSPDLYVRGEGRTGVVTRIKGTRTTLWSQALGLAIADGVAPSSGWSFHHDKKADVYVGSLGKAVSPKLVRRFNQGKRVELSYGSRYLTVGIDGRTGEQLWRRKGADSWCDLIRNLPRTEARALCVVSGVSVNKKGREPWDEDLAVELQGIDPTTGEIAWTFGLAGRDATRAYADGRVPLAPYGIVLPSDDGPVALDERTGKLQQVDADAVLLCATDNDRITVYGSERSAGTLYSSCTSSGRPVKATPSEFGVSALEGAGPLRIVSLPGRVVAFRAP